MPLPPEPFIVDTHQDLAYHCLEHNRELADCGGGDCMITLPWLKQAGVRLVCATLFTEPREPEFTRRYKLHTQYEMYLEWFETYRDELWLIRSQSDLARLGSAAPVKSDGGSAYPIGVILMIEGCDLLDGAVELGTWFERGVRMLCLTWNGANRFATGCFAGRSGLTRDGTKLLDAMESLGVILDLSHLNEHGIDEALARFKGAVCSGHTNARGICDIERNIADRQAVAVAERGGVIGINMLAPLVVRGWKRGDPLPSIADAVSHAEYLAGLTGRTHVGIGADLDGGLTPENTPAGINRITDLPRLGEALSARGWRPADVVGFMGSNWWRFFERSLPA
jgi:membrane dipeptidase